MQHNYIRTLAASVLFLALSALKLFFPGMGRSLRSDICGLINADNDYRAAISALGERIAGPEGLLSVFKSAEADEVDESGGNTSAALRLDRLDPANWRIFSPIATQAAAEPTPAASPLPSAETTTGPSPTAPPEETSVPEPALPAMAGETGSEATVGAEETQNAAVAAFLESQADYADQAIPANVSYDMPTLPFPYRSPTPGLRGDGFGYRLHPLEGQVKFHYGTDLPAISGDDLYAFADGSVSFVGEEEGYGNYLILDHGSGYTTLYAHCSHIYLSIGQSVSCGDKIALAGSTGKVTGPHLHFELKSGSTYLNPEYYLNDL